LKDWLEDAMLRIELLIDAKAALGEGPLWDVEEQRLYWIDSLAPAIRVCDAAGTTGRVANRRTFASFAAQRGYPDGATVDAAGYVWSVEVYSGRLIRFAPDGSVDRMVGLPVASATSISFGGPDLDVAFITSMARPIDGIYPVARGSTRCSSRRWPSHRSRGFPATAFFAAAFSRSTNSGSKVCPNRDSPGD
jgi:sugar lactone lactonase YvrE